MNEESLEILIENEKEWRRFIIQTMERFHSDVNKKIDNLGCEQIKQGKAIARLKTRATIWGFTSGAIPAAIAVIWAYMRSKI